MILNYLRTGQLVLPDGEAARQELQIELDFYQFQHLPSASAQQVLPFEGSTLLSDELHHYKLIEWWHQTNSGTSASPVLPTGGQGNKESGAKWKLLYRGSRDNTTPTSFHERCDNQGETFVVARSFNGFLFGGYTSVPWNSNGGYNADPKAFLFTLINPHGIPPTRYVVQATRTTYATYFNSDYNAAFGGGHDMFLGRSGFLGAYTNFPHSYADTTGKGIATFTGGRELNVADVEVWTLFKGETNNV